ncbi:hypothetical protein ACFL29_00645 [Patescibacteria group bacterium]
MQKLLQDAGVDEYSELGKILVQVINERVRQRGIFPKEFDNQNNSYEWVGYLVKTMGKGLEGYPIDPQKFREQCIHAIALLCGAVLAIDRNPQNIIKKEEP